MIEIVNDNTAAPSPAVSDSKSEMDEIDAIINNYKNAPPVSMQSEGPTTPQNPATSGPLPFITHDPSQAPKQEYYLRGAKKGQPKPPKKGQAPPLNPAGQLSIAATTFITGAIFITMIDLLLPLLIAGVYNFLKMRKDPTATPLDYEKMKMTTSQRSDLSVVGDAVVRELKISGSPSLLFLLGLAGVYFMNFILQKSLADKKTALENTKQKSNEKTNSIYPEVPNRQGNFSPNPY